MTTAAEKLQDAPAPEKPLSDLYDLMEKSWAFAVDMFDPDEDGMIQFLAQDAEGKLSIFATPWHNDFEKTLILNMLRKNFKEMNVLRYVLLTEAWTAKYEGEAAQAEDKVMPRDHPERMEKLVLLGVDPGNHEIMQYAATINRDANGKRSLAEREVADATMEVKGVMLELLGPFEPRTVQ